MIDMSGFIPFSLISLSFCSSSQGKQEKLPYVKQFPVTSEWEK